MRRSAISRVGVIQPRSVQPHGLAAGRRPPAEPELALPAFLTAEEVEQACGWQALGQFCGLRACAHPVQRVQQEGNGAVVVEGGVRGGAAGQCDDLPGASTQLRLRSSHATAYGSSRAWAAGSRSSSVVICLVASAARSADKSVYRATVLSRGRARRRGWPAW